jgi:hypothetical protein
MATETTTPINIAYPEAGELQLQIGVGACRFRITPGAGDAWVQGTYVDPTDALPLKVEENGGRVSITQERNPAKFSGRWNSGPPHLDLGLGTTQPYTLTLEGGASEDRFDLGGLPLTRLVMKQGAGKFTIDFSADNPQTMSRLELQGGAGAIEMRNVANANFAEMTVDGGAASYKFDFGGALQQDGHVRISAGMASIEISVPAGTAARITTSSTVGSVHAGAGFTKRDGAYWTDAAVAGRQPLLTIEASVSVGSLRLLTT